MYFSGLAAVLVMVVTGPIAFGQGEYAVKPADLSVELRVVEAIEDGPIIVEILLQNISKQPVHFYAYDSRYRAPAFCTLSLPVRKSLAGSPVVFVGFFGPHQYRLEPKELARHRLVLQKKYKEILPGEITADFGWVFFERPTEKQKVDILFKVVGQKRIAILPATKERLENARRRLELDFDKFAVLDKGGPNESKNSSADHWRSWINEIDGCRHVAFVPLLLRALHHGSGQEHREALIENIYDCFPAREKAFLAIVDCLGNREPTFAADLFRFWSAHTRKHDISTIRKKHLADAISRRESISPDSKEAEIRNLDLTIGVLRHEEEAWLESKRHADLRPTIVEKEMLRSISNVWIRSLTYATFPEDCPADWIATLHDDLRQVVRTPDSFGELIKQLAAETFQEREEAVSSFLKNPKAYAWHLWAVRTESLPIDIVRRVTYLKEKIPAPELPPLWKDTMALMSVVRQPHCKGMMDILRHAEYPNLISLSAERAWARIRD